MSGRRDRDGRTRRRLLESATRLIAERGFQHVTVRAICLAARANVAAVNYHFRDKLGLYREVLDHAAAVVVEGTEEAARAGAGLPPDDRLRAYVRVHGEYLQRVGPRNRLQQLIHRELQEPTPLLSSIIERVWRPRFEYLGTIVAELLGLAPDDPRVVRTVVSIHAQIMMFKPSPAHACLGRVVRSAFNADAVVDHIAAFSLSGLDAYRRHASNVGRPAARDRP